MTDFYEAFYTSFLYFNPQFYFIDVYYLKRLQLLQFLNGKFDFLCYVMRNSLR